MNITREVIIDLLPVYSSGEASADTMSLVEAYLRTDPELSELIGDERVPSALTPCPVTMAPGSREAVVGRGQEAPPCLRRASGIRLVLLRSALEQPWEQRRRAPVADAERCARSGRRLAPGRRRVLDVVLRAGAAPAHEVGNRDRRGTSRLGPSRRRQRSAGSSGRMRHISFGSLNVSGRGSPGAGPAKTMAPSSSS